MVAACVVSSLLMIFGSHARDAKIARITKQISLSSRIPMWSIFAFGLDAKKLIFCIKKGGTIVTLVPPEIHLKFFLSGSRWGGFLGQVSLAQCERRVDDLFLFEFVNDVRSRCRRGRSRTTRVAESEILRLDRADPVFDK